MTSLHHSGSRGTLDQFNLISVGGVNEDKAATGGASGWSVRDLDALGLQRVDGVIQVVHLEGQVDEVLLDLDRAAWRETAELDQLLAVGDGQKGQLRAARGCLAFEDFQPQDVLVKCDRLVHVTDAHSSVQQLLHSHLFPSWRLFTLKGLSAIGNFRKA